ncbi:hypothetical protein KC19_4G103300 [Ceratodon purpureus]|uniref:Uncharacterized protein n=1 Tax=Ceratodon purpureus TaxID=3225 RepID=A0A8T0IAJ9_CERPU|nr:hypothetical protein KC19_4G103200 [Ceratodon purpureus]KAG0579498.1 hypothetical protein KC19_4G103300 [Ceratodon purpureus]
MESQDPDDWQLPLSQLPVDPSQPSSSRRRLRDEAGPSERCVQPRTEPGISQFTLPALQLDNRALVIVLESEPTLSGNYQMVFEGCFENNNEGQMVSRISSEVGHCFWLQGQLNLLTRERRASFIAAVILRILEFLSV